MEKAFLGDDRKPTHQLFPMKPKTPIDDESIVDGIVGGIVHIGGTVALFALVYWWIESYQIAIAVVMFAWLIYVGSYDHYLEWRRNKAGHMREALPDNEPAKTKREQEEEAIFSALETKESIASYEELMENVRQGLKERQVSSPKAGKKGLKDGGT